MSSHKKVFQKESSGNRKSINTGDISPNAYLAKKPTWKFNKCDLSSTKWSILDVKSFDRDVLSKLIAYEGMTWVEARRGLKLDDNGSNKIRLSAMKVDAAREKLRRRGVLMVPLNLK